MWNLNTAATVAAAATTTITITPHFPPSPPRPAHGSARQNRAAAVAAQPRAAMPPMQPQRWAALEGRRRYRAAARQRVEQEGRRPTPSPAAFCCRGEQSRSLCTCRSPPHRRISICRGCWAGVECNFGFLFFLVQHANRILGA